MKAEERKHLHQNEFATGLKNAWQTIASGSTVNTIVWGVILLGLVLGGILIGIKVVRRRMNIEPPPDAGIIHIF